MLRKQIIPVKGSVILTGAFRLEPNVLDFVRKCDDMVPY